MRVLVCGGRDFNNYQAFDDCMIMLEKQPTLIIQGGARGADALAKQWAITNGVHQAEVPALWDTYGKNAGWKRNAAMLQLHPEYGIALPGGRGTEGMVRRMMAIGIPVWRPYS